MAISEFLSSNPSSTLLLGNLDLTSLSSPASAKQITAVLQTMEPRQGGKWLIEISHKLLELDEHSQLTLGMPALCILSAISGCKTWEAMGMKRPDYEKMGATKKLNKLALVHYETQYCTLRSKEILAKRCHYNWPENLGCLYPTCQSTHFFRVLSKSCHSSCSAGGKGFFGTPAGEETKYASKGEELSASLDVGGPQNFAVWHRWQNLRRQLFRHSIDGCVGHRRRGNCRRERC